MRLTFTILLILVASEAAAIDCQTEIQYVCPTCSPIVINFAEGGYRLTGANAPVLFDLSATGQPFHVGWTAAEADEAFLCLDRDGDGKITSGAELFGSATPLKSGNPAGNGFIALAELDDNGDSVIDEGDSIWPRLLLWRDLNHDGNSQEWEISPVTESDLKGISLDLHWTGRRDSWGNVFRYQSIAWIGKAGKNRTPHPVYDIFFIPVP